MDRTAWTLLLLAVLATSSEPVEAQLIPIRTVPVASGDQFRILPSATGGMGDVRIAIEDSLGGAWSNPALGSLVGATAFVGAPVYYAISERRGGARTFPVAGLFSGGAWFGGASLALQQVEDAEGDDLLWFAPTIDICCVRCCGGGPRTLSETFGRNVYATGYVGRRLSDRWSIGLGLAAAELGAMDGVDLLYAGSSLIEQDGSTSEVRVGAYHSGPRDRLSLLLLHSQVSMRHEVTWVDFGWDADAQIAFQRTRVDLNEDETRTWGAHATWDRSLSAEGWRVGATATLNYKDHPKIPNYVIQSIPRDPGTTWAYEAGFGFSRTDERTTFALDVALQPIWSETWQEANAQDVEDSEGRLEVGDRSIDNDFFFTNLMLRSGLSALAGRTRLQAGLEIRSYAYTLEQVDHVSRGYREQDEAWIEWSPTVGVVVPFEALDLHYTGRLTTGTGRPGTRRLLRGDVAALSSADFLLAPEAPLTLESATVMTHQISVHIPIR